MSRRGREKRAARRGKAVPTPVEPQPAARPSYLIAQVDVGTNVAVDGVHLPTAAMLAVRPDAESRPRELATRVGAEDLQSLLHVISRELDRLEQETGRPVAASITFSTSTTAWRAVVAEHELQVDDPRLIELDD